MWCWGPRRVIPPTATGCPMRGSRIRSGNLLRDGSSDFDQDGQSDREEFEAGTDPRDGKAFFGASIVRNPGSDGVVITWPSAPGRTYSIDRAETLRTFAPYETGRSRIGRFNNLVDRPPRRKATVPTTRSSPRTSDERRTIDSDANRACNRHY